MLQMDQKPLKLLWAGRFQCPFFVLAPQCRALPVVSVHMGPWQQECNEFLVQVMACICPL